MRGRLVVVLCAGLSVATSVWAQSGPYVAPEYFHWRESYRNIDVTETGWRVVLGYRERGQRERSGIVFPGDFRVYGGTADYDGFLQTSHGLIPHKTQTDYAGLAAEVGVGYQWRLGTDYTLTPYGSVIGDFWWRGLQGQGGYDELWWTVPLRVGLELGAPGNHGWLAGVSLKAPVYTQVSSDDIPGIGSSTSHPKTKLSGDAELGYRLNKRLSLLGFFESYWFGRSSVNSSGVFQPESKMYTAGLKAVLHF
ncbi:MAG TPA: hypothetical protein VL486_16405 [Verrucomicrobiae bacterium]|nr:hypothetical protein [Verrucomicrobiae bacterium]